MKKILLWSSLLLLVQQGRAQSLKDELNGCADAYIRYATYFMATDTRNRPELFSKFEALFSKGALLEHPLPQLPTHLTAQDFAIGLAGFSDKTELKLEGLRYGRSTLRTDVFEIYAMQTFIGQYLKPKPLELPRFGVILSVVREPDGIFRIAGIEKMPREFVHDPDSDGDGIPDRLDKCPWLAGELETDGAHPIKPCPKDADGDGTPDAQDKCPNQFGELEDGGCPNYTQEELIAIQRIEEVKKNGADSLSLPLLWLERLPSAIKQLANLKKLNLFGNHLNNVSAIWALKQLTTLNLGGNEISDMSKLGLQYLTQLTTLYLQDNIFSDLSALQALKQLKLTSLDLSSNSIKDLSKIMPTLRSLKQLTRLGLGYNQLSDVSALRALKQLTTLDLGYNQLSDASVLRELKQLTTLDLGSNQLSDVSALRELKQLTTLNLGSNQFSDVSALRELKQLTTLNLWGNQISDVSALQELKQLTTLDLSLNQLRDVSMLRDLKYLTVLNLRYNEIKKFNLDLKPFLNLKSVCLSGNPIQNIPKEIIGEDWNNCLDALRAYQNQQRK
jgi:Leucine-rich repeat (LRR) protein